MEGFSYADPERVKRIIKGQVTGSREELLIETLINHSAKLSAWFPGLRTQWEDAAEGSELKELVRVMVSESAKKIVSNPEQMSSETMGPYAYSRFDSEDAAKALFPARDLAALESLLRAEQQKNVGSFHTPLAIQPHTQVRPGYGPKTHLRRGRIW